MGTTIKERTLEFIKYKGISVKEFEMRCGMSNGYVSSMRKGFGTDKLSNVLSAFPELNREWLLYGEGEMLISPSPPIDVDSPVMVLDISSDVRGGSTFNDQVDTEPYVKRYIPFSRDVAK